MPDRTVVAKTFSSTIDAEIARDRLKDEGIDAFLRKDDAGGAYPQLQRTQGVHLVTTEEDAPRARDLLEAMQESTDAPTSKIDPEQVEKTYADLSWALLIMGSAFVLLALLVDLGETSLGTLTGVLGALFLLAGGAIKLYRWTRRRPPSTSEPQR